MAHQVQILSVSALGRLSVEGAILLVGAITSLLFLLSLFVVYDNSFVHPDFYRYILQETLRDGLPLQWRDLINSLQLRSPGEFRSRFLAYLIQALDQKSRLSLYDYILVAPNFSPLAWVLELCVGPYFLFRAVQNLTSDRIAATAATIVYTASIGFLSGFTMVLLQGKNLSNVIFILCIYLASQGGPNAKGRAQLLFQQPGFEKYVLLIVMFLGLFLDELPIFAFCLVPLLFPSYFVPPLSSRPYPWRPMLMNALFFSVPVIVFLTVVLFLVPELTERYFGFRFDYLGNTLLINEHTRGASSLLEGPYAHFSWYLVYENAMTLFGFATIPSELSPFIKSDYGNYPGTQSANLIKWIIVVAVIVVTAALCIWGREPARSYLRRMPLVLFAFFLFLTLLSIRHIPIATGYYYGATFASLFAVFVGLCYGAIPSVSLRIPAAAATLFLVVAGLNNFSEVNRGWIITHNETLTRSSFQSKVQLAEPRKLTRQELLAIWSAWKRGQLDRYLDESPISTGAVYLVAELQTLDQARSGTIPSAHRLVEETGY